MYLNNAGLHDKKKWLKMVYFEFQSTLFEWSFSTASHINPWTTGNIWRFSQVWVSIVAGDALVLKHQAITIRNTDSMVTAPYQFHK